MREDNAPIEEGTFPVNSLSLISNSSKASKAAKSAEKDNQLRREKIFGKIIYGYKCELDSHVHQILCHLSALLDKYFKDVTYLYVL